MIRLGSLSILDWLEERGAPLTWYILPTYCKSVSWGGQPMEGNHNWPLPWGCISIVTAGQLPISWYNLWHFDTLVRSYNSPAQANKSFRPWVLDLWTDQSASMMSERSICNDGFDDFLKPSELLSWNGSNWDHKRYVVQSLQWLIISMPCVALRNTRSCHRCCHARSRRSLRAVPGLLDWKG